MLRIATTALILLLGIVALLAAGTMDSGLLRGLLQGIGSFLIGTIVVAYAYQYFLDEEVEDRIMAKLDDALRSRMDRIVPGVYDYGFCGFTPGEAPRKVFRDLRSGDELLWLDTYSPDQLAFNQDLREAVRAGARVRMLVIDPNADTARMRAEEISDPGIDPARFTRDTQAFLDYVLGVAGELGEETGQLEVRCYEDLPCAPMYLRLRNGKPVEGITGYFLSDPTFEAPHLVWDTADGMLSNFHCYFERKWKRHAGEPDSQAQLSSARP